MAEMQVEAPAQTHSGQQPSRRGGARLGSGRPEGAKDKQPRSNARTAPPVEPQAEQQDDFFALLKTFPAEDWTERKFMYLYRTAPLTDRRATGQDLNLMKYMKPIDSHDIMLEFGSGGYKLLLDEYDPGTQKTRVLRTHYFKIFNIDHPPRIPYGEWLDDDRNKDWLWAKPKLLAAQQAAGTPPPQPAAGNEVGLLNAVVAAVKELRPNAGKQEQESLTAQVMKMMGDSHKEALAAAKNGPTETLALVNAIVGAIGGKKDGADPMLTYVLDELKEARKANTDLLMKMLERKDEPKTKSVREELLEIREIAGEFFGGGGKNGKTDWGEVAKDVGLEALHIIGDIAKAIGIAKITGKPGTPAAPDTETRALPEGQPDPHAKPTPEQQAHMLAQLNEQFGGLLDSVAPFLVDQFKTGLTGMHFRDWFLDRYGSLAYDALAQMSKETIVALLDTRRREGPPHIKNMLAELTPPERVLEFVVEFQSDADAPEDEDNSNSAESPAAATSPTGRAPNEF